MKKESNAKKEARFKWNRQFAEFLKGTEQTQEFWQSAEYYRVCEKLTPMQAAYKFKDAIITSEVKR